MKILTLLIALMLVATVPAQAEPRYTAAKRAAEKVKKDERELKRRVKRLSQEQREKLKTVFKSTDSDSDGVADIIEGAVGGNRCDADTDDDGLDDSEDFDEDNADSDGDGNSDANEVEVKASIVSFEDPTLVVGERTFTLTDATVFRGTGFDKSDLVAGLCVEVEGHLEGENTIADKIKRESSSECN